MENKDNYYFNLIDLLGISVREFTSVFEKDDGVYPILGDFGQFIVSNIDNIEIIEKCFLFINEAIEKGDDLTQEAISIEIFEQLYATNELIDFARNHLRCSSLNIFNEYLNKYRSTHV